MNSLNQLIEPGTVVLLDPSQVSRAHRDSPAHYRFQVTHGFGLFPNTKGRGIWGQFLETGEFGIIQGDRITAVERGGA